MTRDTTPYLWKPERRPRGKIFFVLLGAIPLVGLIVALLILVAHIHDIANSIR